MSFAHPVRLLIILLAAGLASVTMAETPEERLAAVGMASLPSNIAVEIEAIVELHDE